MRKELIRSVDKLVRANGGKQNTKSYLKLIFCDNARYSVVMNISKVPTPQMCASDPHGLYTVLYQSYIIHIRIYVQTRFDAKLLLEILNVQLQQAEEKTAAAQKARLDMEVLQLQKLEVICRTRKVNPNADLRRWSVR